MSLRFFHVAVLFCREACLVESVALADTVLSKVASTANATSSGAGHVASFSDINANKNSGYTDNSFCRKNNCINPLYPGFLDLPRLEKVEWQCATHSLVTDYMSFCKDVVDYDPALPSPSKSTPVNHLVRSQEDAAMTMFAYHLSGMGYDFWDYQQPGNSDSDCVRSVWKMVCFTYFPRSSPGCKLGEQSLYKKPCASCCQNYILHCGVECCDESVKCTFDHQTQYSNGTIVLTQTGYVDVEGPSALCTGDAKLPVHLSFSFLTLIFALKFR
jgi:hypothetical protein